MGSLQCYCFACVALLAFTDFVRLEEWRHGNEGPTPWHASMTPEDMITGGPALQLDATLFSTLRVHRVPHPPLSTPVVKLYAIVRHTVNPYDPADDCPRFQHRSGADAVLGGNFLCELSGSGLPVDSTPLVPAFTSTAGNTSAREDTLISACAGATLPSRGEPRTPKMGTCNAGSPSKKQRTRSQSASHSCTFTMDRLSSACVAEHPCGCKDASGPSALFDPAFSEVKLKH